MKKIIFLFTFCIIYQLLIYNSIAQSGWFLVNTGTTVVLTNVEFVNDTTGWYATLSYYYTNQIMKTTNGGINWFAQTWGSEAAEQINTIDFVDPNTGWIGGTGGIFLKTTNGGASSFNQNISEGGTNSMCMINSQTGWICGCSYSGDSGTIHKTTDGGNNWINQLNLSSNAFICIFFVDENYGWSITYYNKIMRTINSGLTWVYVDPQYSASNLFFTDLNTGYAVKSGNIFKSTNGGTNWFIQSSYTSNTLNIIKFVNSNTGWIAGSGGMVLCTINAGTNWITQNSNTTANLTTLSMVDSHTGYAGGGYGVIIKTTDGGGLFTGIKLRDNYVPTSFSLSQNYPNPFNPTTKIKFEIPNISPPFTKGGLGVLTTLMIYDILGSDVATLVNEELKPGSYEYEWDGSNFASGVYFYKLSVTGGATVFTETKRMVLLK